jgi:hypothetical protein
LGYEGAALSAARVETNPQQATMIKPGMAPLKRMFSPSFLCRHKGRVHDLFEIIHFRAPQNNKKWHRDGRQYGKPHKQGSSARW